MNESNFIKAIAIDKTILSEQTKLWLSKVIGIGNYFHQEINQRKSWSKKKKNCYFIEKILIVLSATSRRVSIILFTSIAGASVGIARPILT